MCHAAMGVAALIFLTAIVACGSVGLVDIISVVNLRYHSSCLTLLHQQVQDLQRLSELAVTQKELAAKLNVVVNAVTSEHFMSSKKESWICANKNAPLHILLPLENESVMHNILLQFSQKELLSHTRWLMLSNRSANDFEEHFSGIYLPFDCEFLVVQLSDLSLFKLHRVVPNYPLHIRLLAGPGFFWIAKQKPLQLEGIRLSGAVYTSGYGPEEHINDVIQVPYLQGYTGKIWIVMQQSANFSTDLYLVDTLGYIAENGSSTGIFKMLLSGKVDIALETSTITVAYKRYVKFLSPTWKYRLMTYVRRPDLFDSPWEGVIAPFSSDMWIALAFAMLVLTIILWITWNIGYSHGTENNDVTSGFSITEALLFVHGIFCQQGHDLTPCFWPCRLVYLTAYLTAVVVYQAYSTIIISFLTVQRPHLPFKDFKGLLEDDSYTFGVTAYNKIVFEFRTFFFVDSQQCSHCSNFLYQILNGGLYSQFPDSKLDNKLPLAFLYGIHFLNATDETMRTMYRRYLAEGSQPDKEGDGILQLCNAENYAFMTAEVFVRRVWNEIRCKIVQVPYAYVETYGSVAVGKSFPYTDLFNSRLIDMMSFGILKRIAYDDSPPPMLELPDMEAATVSLESVAPIFIILLAGMILALLSLSVELHLCKPPPSYLNSSIPSLDTKHCPKVVTQMP